MSCDSLRILLEEFLEDFQVKGDTDPEVDSPVAHWNYFYEPLVSCPG